MNNTLQDKVVLITGASRGIGAASAEAFAELDAKVVITSRSQDNLSAVAQSINGTVHALACDVQEDTQVEQLFENIHKKYGPIDILINNAAVIKVCDFMDFTIADWDWIMRVNLRGAFLCALHAFHDMRTSGGSIVNISSLGGIKGTEKFKGFSAYTVSKHGIVGLTESLAVEGREYGIRVNCIAPGAVDTQMLKEAAPFRKTNTTPQDIAKTILYLADANQSPSVTGAIIEVHSNIT